MSTVPFRILEWTPEYSVHVAKIDGEHQTLFSAISRLHDAMLNGNGSDLVKSLLKEMTEYTFYHFSNEEALMSAVQYPGIRAHVEQHDVLRRQVRAFVERFECGEATMTIELTLFLTDWIKRHVMKDDRQLGDYIGTSHSPR